jgi:hypothetical protein
MRICWFCGCLTVAKLTAAAQLCVGWGLGFSGVRVFIFTLLSLFLSRSGMPKLLPLPAAATANSAPAVPRAGAVAWLSGYDDDGDAADCPTSSLSAPSNIAHNNASVIAAARAKAAQMAERDAENLAAQQRKWADSLMSASHVAPSDGISALNSSSTSSSAGVPFWAYGKVNVNAGASGGAGRR